MKTQIKQWFTILFACSVCIRVFAAIPEIAHAQSNSQTGNIAIHAIVPPHTLDFQFAITADSGEMVHQDQTITYEITYGASSSAEITTSNTIVVRYSDTKDPNNAFIVDYVIGSASKAYGDVQPVVDLKNRTITWDLITVPQGTVDQKVTFQLKTNASYSGKTDVPFITKASMSNEYTTLPEQIVYHKYIFNPSLLPPTPTSKPGPTPTTAPQPVIIPLRITDISLTALSPNSATIGVSTSKATKTIIHYGTAQNALNQTAQNASYAFYNTVDLSGLKPNTVYYFQATSTAFNGRYFRSDIYTFTTPSQSARPDQLNGQAIVTISSDNTVLLSKLLNSNSDSSGLVLLPSGKTYLLAYNFVSAPHNATLELIIRNDLGIERKVELLARNAATFIAQIKANLQGKFDMYIVQTDEKGNVMSRKISSMRIVSPLKVIDKSSAEPLGDARILLSYYNSETNRYEPLDQSLSIKNPEYTNIHGEVMYSLPLGTYKAEVSAASHKSRTIVFTLGPKDDQDYPTIDLEPDVLNVAYFMFYIKDRFIDTYTTTLTAMETISESIRVYNALAFGGLGSMSVISLLLFRIRTNLYWKDLLPFFIFHIAVLRNKHKSDYLMGNVLDENGKPIADARIEVLLLKSPQVVAHTTTDRQGRFQLRNLFKEAYVTLVIAKDGYPIVEMIAGTDTQKPLLMHLRKKMPASIGAKSSLCKEFTGGFFEVILIGSLLAELLFLNSFGLAKTLPFIVISFFNLFLWIFYQRRSHLN